ncbi:MAG: hypothetical protein ACW981_15970 [Candidatus Hodarchaeales archaeon]|jgi:hypothetical protein
MDVIYKNYEPNKGFDEIQAKIYNEAVKPYSGSEVTVEGIKERHEKNKPDFNGIRFAFTSENKPLAYIQYHYYSSLSEKLYIGYPWSVEECPKEIQEEMYQNLLSYVKTKYSSDPIFLGYFSSKYEKVSQFALEHGFLKNHVDFNYEGDIQSLSDLSIDKLEWKTASKQNLDLLVDLSQTDPDISKSMTRSQFEEYLIGRVFPDGHCFMLSESNKAVAACAPLKLRDSSVFMRFSAVRDGRLDYLRKLTIQFSQYLLNNSIADKNLQLNFTNVTPEIQKTLDELGFQLIDTQVQYKLV